MDVEREIGAEICAQTGKAVDLHHPDLTVHIEILSRDAFYSAIDHRSGPGGLPVGISGKVVCLISGGIDSPVAAHRMMKRGCEPGLRAFLTADPT